MTNSNPVIKDLAPRRSFFGHLGGALVLGLAGLAPKSAACTSAGSASLTVLTGLER